jgi:uncharacterized membrane protein
VQPVVTAATALPWLCAARLSPAHAAQLHSLSPWCGQQLYTVYSVRG